MNTRFVRSSRRFRLTAIIALCLLALAGTTSFALNRSGHGQKDPSPIAYEEDEDPVPEGVAALMDSTVCPLGRWVLIGVAVAALRIPTNLARNAPDDFSGFEL